MRADEILVIHKGGGLVYAYARDPASAHDAQYRAGRLLELLSSLRASWRGYGFVDRFAFGDTTVLLLEGRHVVLMVDLPGARVAREERLAKRLLAEIEGRYGERLDGGEVHPAVFSGIDALLAPLRGA